MGSHFDDWVDYNGVAFLIELLQWGRTFLDFFGLDSSSYLWLANILECTVVKNKVVFIPFNNGSIHKNRR